MRGTEGWIRSPRRFSPALILLLACQAILLTADAAAAPPLVAAAGDIACAPAHPAFNDGSGTLAECRQGATAKLLGDPRFVAILLLGDNQYETGSLADYRASFDPSWGRIRNIARPVPGNHEYGVAGARDYFRYFGAAAGSTGRGYYSFDLGSWHVVALNSNCVLAGGCGRSSLQGRWLRADLRANPATCTLAFWHHPRFSSGKYESDVSVAPLWNILHRNGADVVLAGHDHVYERFAPLSPDGRAIVDDGIRSFVVGTGGRSHYSFTTPHLGSGRRISESFGLLTLSLRNTEYRWKFISEERKILDSGSSGCH